MKYFAKSPFDPNKTLKIKMFIDFLIYKDRQVAIERDGVQIRIVQNKDWKIDVYENGKNLIKF